MGSVGTVRIAGVIMPPNKHVWVALKGIFGIGKTSALKICDACGIEPSTKIKLISEDELEAIRAEIDANFIVEGDKRRQNALAIKRIIDLKCYRGLRHIRKLPARGQRTKTNARTRKGKKRMPKEAA